MVRKGKILASIFILFFFLEGLYSEEKIYWHLDITCFKDRSYKKKQYTIEEHLWLTLVEFPKRDAYPDETTIREIIEDGVIIRDITSPGILIDNPQGT